MHRHDILSFFEHRSDGTWICTKPVRLTTKRAEVDIRQGKRFGYGEKVAGVDLAEYLESLGAQFGS